MYRILYFNKYTEKYRKETTGETIRQYLNNMFIINNYIYILH